MVSAFTGGWLMQVLESPPPGRPALVLNADYRPLSYYPLSLWPWQEVVKAVFLDRVDVISTYDTVIRSPNFEMALPSVVSLKHFVAQDRPPAFTRFNLFLRDAFCCQYCGSAEDLTFDHIVPRSRGGRTTWENIVTACARCNLAKGGRTPREAAMFPRHAPQRPNMYELQERGRRFPPNHLHHSWLDYLYWDIELEA
jgi:5-methylcytosine-specific restriction endonuclease McrA